MGRIYLVLITAFFLLTFPASPAMAHKVIVFAYVQGDSVYVESKFAGGRKVKQGNVSVSDSSGTVLLTGTTDDAGNFSFKPPNAGDLVIQINAGVGHLGKWTVTASELADAVKGPENEPAASKQTSTDSSESESAKSQPETKSESIQPAVDPRVLEKMISKAVKREIKPVLDILVEARTEGPSFKDILGGIGYIFGLFGVAAYMASRKKGKNNS